MTFEQFVGERIRLWLAIARGMGADPSTAEDLVQDAIERIFRNWDRVREAASPDAYARRLLTNQIITEQRRRIPRLSAERRLARQTRSGAELAPDPAGQSADRQVLAEEINQLPERQRAVLVLRYYAGLSDNEIAETLDCSPGAVRSYASRALARLRVHTHELLPSGAERQDAR